MKKTITKHSNGSITVTPCVTPTEYIGICALLGKTLTHGCHPSFLKDNPHRLRTFFTIQNIAFWTEAIPFLEVLGYEVTISQ